jgi:hypothetical protein
VLATKYTVSRDRDDPNAAGNHRKNMRLSLDTSLRRLRTDYLDIYWVHMWDRDTPIEETMRALDDEVRAGRILYVGISDTPAWLIARANTLAQWHDWTPFTGLQVPYSLLQRDIERELLPMAQTLGMTVAAWSPLAGGILSGKFTQPHEPERGTRINPASISEHQRGVATTLQAVADDVGATPSQVAIAWAQKRGVDECAGSGLGGCECGRSASRMPAARPPSRSRVSCRASWPGSAARRDQRPGRRSRSVSRRSPGGRVRRRRPGRCGTANPRSASSGLISPIARPIVEGPGLIDHAAEGGMGHGRAGLTKVHTPAT